jgi:hypothetical protein
MKNLIVLTAFLSFNFIFSQEEYKSGQVGFQKPKDGKSLVYFTRSGGAFLINFRLYFNDKFIGALSSGNYFKVECEPGKHMFWAASENRDFVEAELEANKVYVIDLVAKMGAFVASVSLEPQNPLEKKHKKRFYKSVRDENAIIYNPNEVKEDKAEAIS